MTVTKLGDLFQAYQVVRPGHASIGLISERAIGDDLRKEFVGQAFDVSADCGPVFAV
jgi:hypothetical protein